MGMEKKTLMLLKGFYENELKTNILPFWLQSSIDKTDGGYFSCFSNDGKTLVSTDKYTWSLGRFAWIFSKFASSPSEIWNKEERQQFLGLAKVAADFIKAHCLVAPDVYRCVYYMERDGKPKKVPGYNNYDVTYAVDAFVVVGMAKYAIASNDLDSYIFAKNLFMEMIKRLKEEDETIPYRWSRQFVFQGDFQNALWMGTELYDAAEVFDESYTDEIKPILKEACEGAFKWFVNEEDLFFEMAFADSHKDPANMLTNHINPGHAPIVMSYLLKAAQILNNSEHIKRACKVMLTTLDIGWDQEYGGYFHFCGKDGGFPAGTVKGFETEFFTEMVPRDWSDKLWWVNAENLCSAIRGFEITGDQKFIDYHDRLFEYVFSVFPNPDKEIREWIQIRDRYGRPLEKITAVPVKDPFHVMRSIMLVIESLERMLQKVEETSSTEG